LSEEDRAYIAVLSMGHFFLSHAMKAWVCPIPRDPHETSYTKHIISCGFLRSRPVVPNLFWCITPFAQFGTFHSSRM